MGLDQAGYSEDSVYNRLTPEQREFINDFYTSLLNPETINEVSEEVHSAKEAAERLGLTESEVRPAYGMLEAIEDGFVEGDGRIEFRAFDLSKREASEDGGEDSDDDSDSSDRKSSAGGGLSGLIADKYIGRVRYNSENVAISLVLDVVPPLYGNAVYVTRNDDGRLGDVEEMFDRKISKVELRAGGSRSLPHTRSGEAGLLKRINKALTMPYEHFLDKKNYPRLD
jgi:hypothetical protein